MSGGTAKVSSSVSKNWSIYMETILTTKRVALCTLPYLVVLLFHSSRCQGQSGSRLGESIVHVEIKTGQETSLLRGIVAYQADGQSYALVDGLSLKRNQSLLQDGASTHTLADRPAKILWIDGTRHRQARAGFRGMRDEFFLIFSAPTKELPPAVSLEGTKSFGLGDEVLITGTVSGSSAPPIKLQRINHRGVVNLDAGGRNFRIVYSGDFDIRGCLVLSDRGVPLGRVGRRMQSVKSEGAPGIYTVGSSNVLKRLHHPEFGHIFCAASPLLGGSHYFLCEFNDPLSRMESCRLLVKSLPDHLATAGIARDTNRLLNAIKLDLVPNQPEPLILKQLPRRPEFQGAPELFGAQHTDSLSTDDDHMVVQVEYTLKATNNGFVQRTHRLKKQIVHYSVSNARFTSSQP